ncbi:MAG: tetratricopeptide repeat protein [Desulfobacterales bacterium]|nr:tetratricopeptide repeat protein [Desulfobacterales bacterium]
MKKTIILCLIGVILAIPFSPVRLTGAENWYENGVSLLNSGKYEEAIKAFSLSIETLPHDYESFNKRGVAYIGAGDINRAVSDFTKAIEINPLFADALSNRCAALCDRGDYDRAIEDCTRAIEINPRSSKAHNNRGISLNNKGFVENAVADYIKAIEINPGYADAYNNLAWIYATCPDKNFRNGERALSYAEKAVRLSSDPYYLDTLAAALAENNRFEEAVETEEKVIAAAGGNENKDVYEERLELYEAHKPLRDTRLVIQINKEKIKEPVKPPSSATAGDTPVPKAPEQIYALSCDGNCPYSVQAGSFRDYTKSYDEAMKLKAKGQTAFNSYSSVKKGGGGWYRVLTGAFETLREAQKAASALKAIGIHGALAVKTPYVIIIFDTPFRKELQRLESDKIIYYPVKDKKGREKIFVGAFETKKDAEFFSAKLKEKGYKIIIVKR